MQNLIQDQIQCQEHLWDDFLQSFAVLLDLVFFSLQATNPKIGGCDITNSLSQWLTFRLLGITYLVEKNMF